MSEGLEELMERHNERGQRLQEYREQLDAKDLEIEALKRNNQLLVQSLKVCNSYIATLPHVATGALKREDFQKTDELMADVGRLLKMHLSES